MSIDTSKPVTYKHEKKERTLSQSVLKIREQVSHAAHYLPAQGPITAFVHHNTLHAFEDLPFEQAVEKAAALYGCNPYLSEEQYQAELERGRIRTVDLDTVLKEELGSGAGDVIAGLVLRFELAQNMFVESVPLASEAELQWLIAAGNGVRHFQRRCPSQLRKQMVADTRQWVMRHLRGDRQTHDHLRDMSRDLFVRWGGERIENWSQATWDEVTLTLLWRVCHSGCHSLPRFHKEAKPVLRLRDALLSVYAKDSDLLVHEELIRFCAAFTDQGLAAWNLPQRDLGFYQAFMTLYGQGRLASESWMNGLSKEIKRLQSESISPEDLILESLALAGIQENESEAFITQSLLALRGWAGMLWQLESRPDRVRQAVPPGTLLEFLAVRLLLERFAIEHLLKRELGLKDSPAVLRQSLSRQVQKSSLKEDRHLAPNQRAYVVFLLAQSLGWSPQRLSGLSRSQWQELLLEIEQFSALERRRLFHRAYERRFHVQVLDPLMAYAHAPATTKKLRPLLNVICCIDDREESFRRHLEELEPEIETFGFAGFFGLPMYYRGISDVHEMPLCPVSIRPVHRVVERVVHDDKEIHAQGVSARRQIGLATHSFQRGSHGFLVGLATTLLGSLAAVPLVARVLFPRLTSRLKKRAGALLQSPIRTELTVVCQPDKAKDADGIQEGFLPDEMTAIVGNVLRLMGLTENFARLVVVMGHGSSSLNNPHEAAHDCGACGGGRGGPNARVFAEMANHPVVRSQLAADGLIIPEDTVFLGAYHNTCDESVTYYDLERLSEPFKADYQKAQAVIERACDRNAHERARRFHSADLLISPEDARRHVEARAEDLAQPRPEYGHATNAICIIGRRSRTQGLFLDRRSFLVSYDPRSDASDADSAILTQIMQAAVPVCAGINLEYYFSFVDPSGWGCGTKLPHNITSLLGVMDGSLSDLRPGLPWQMVEIHEPVRLLTIIETTPERLLGILDRNEAIARLCNNGWIWLASLDPESSQIHIFDKGKFRPYQPEKEGLPESWPSSRWYSGLREHLDYAAMIPASSKQAVRNK